MFDLFPALGACGSFDPEKRVNSPTRTETVLSKKSMYMLSGGFTGGREGMKFAFYISLSIVITLSCFCAKGYL
jgi:hypothetical protein